MIGTFERLVNVRTWQIKFERTEVTKWLVESAAKEHSVVKKIKKKVNCIKNSCTMHTLQIRNLPTEVYEALKASAKASKRSMTQEAIEANF